MSQYSGTNPYYSGGGGGYLPGSSFSSPGGFGEEKKSETAHSVRPLTIGQLIRATQAHTDAEWRVENDEIGQISTVAQVMSIQRQATNSVYWLDDGSGRIEGRHWVDSSISEGGKSSGITENIYVRVTGALKSFNTKRYINVTHIRPAKDPHELYFHTMEAMTVNLIFERGPPPGPGQPQQNQVAGASVYTSGPAAAATTDAYASLPAMERSIVEYIAAQPPTDEGVHVAKIARHIGKEAHLISEALESLMEAGITYSTIDDSHFQVC